MNDFIVIADRLQTAVENFENAPFQAKLSALEECADRFRFAWSGSNIGYHACVYHEGFQPPPAGIHFSSEWGLMDPIGMGSRGDWREFSSAYVRDAIFRQANSPPLNEAIASSNLLREEFDLQKSNTLSRMSIESARYDSFMSLIEEQIKDLKYFSSNELAATLVPTQISSRDSTAMHQGFRVAPHQEIVCSVTAIRSPAEAAKSLTKLARQAGSHLERLYKQQTKTSLIGTNVFIGHGRSNAWLELKSFVTDRLRLPFDEFNRVPVAGITNITRLSEMLDAAAVAFIILTAEDEQHDGSMHARMNVLHEVGLFQGRLGFTKAIVMLEDGCDEFSNIQGLGQIRFPTGRIAASFEAVRQVLEREGLITS